MLLPTEKEKKITTKIAVERKGKKMRRNVAMEGTKMMKNSKPKKAKKGKKKKVY